ncbi:PREDICTED: uncharacterized protein LOC105954026 [Erythranthe guttata]|uniref:uncharacterized protein LOC105954026 n=1 Tax=Erythranthe guttata TaxID=4155 RepID=UPI00064DF163|nr:PREDICTED: uncharacterized protein LOC105954026 [Erythranthe guttata]|eukprot:XP_012833153.1 PREDICTED: uncharacterized protein LOC105954026 [Erythranthe guttata]
MPPNNIIPRRILTRRSKDANVEASSVAQELPFVSANSRSEIPSSRVPTSSTSPHLHEDTQGYESESSLSIPENSTVSTKKRGRGATTGKSIEKAITENVQS